MVAAEIRTLLPVELVEKIRDFMDSGKTGNITLDLHEGYVKGWKLTEWGKVSEPNIDKRNTNH